MCSAAAPRRAHLLGAALCLLLVHTSAHAALRNPQVVVNGTGLQWYLDWVHESINVQTDQQDVQVLQPVMSTLATYQFEVGPKDAGLEIGIYDAHLAVPDLLAVFPGTSAPGWFAVVSFKKNPARALVSLFDASAVFQGTTTYLGMTNAGFGFYAQGGGGTFYTQDVRNPGGAAQALFYAGTGVNSGSWWMAFEDTPSGDSDRDFDDAILFNESVNGVPVHAATWSQLKVRFR